MVPFAVLSSPSVQTREQTCAPSSALLRPLGQVLPAAPQTIDIVRRYLVQRTIIGANVYREWTGILLEAARTDLHIDSDVAATAALNLPTSQFKHRVCPVLALYLPATHNSQIPPLLNLPSSQVLPVNRRVSVSSPSRSE